MELALGTVQFGLRYGIAGRDGVVPEDEVRAILSRAAALGIRMLDTAAAYGDIEGRLASLLPPGNWLVVSKLPALPPGITDGDVDGWVKSALDRVTTRLGGRVHGLLLHRAEDLLEPLAQRLWQRCAAWASERGCRLGVSCYEIRTLNEVSARFPVNLAQLPGNALDQRLRTQQIAHAGIELHLRSVFLQGLLLLDEAEAIRRVPAAAPALAGWHRWCRSQDLSPLVAALGFAKGFEGVDYCVVGVDDAVQLDSIATAWRAAPVLRAEALQCTDSAAIDPRRWPARA